MIASSPDPLAPLLALDNLRVSFAIRSPILRRIKMQVDAVAGVDLAVAPGKTMGVVGESGCGKSTMARAIVGLERPTGGSIRFAGEAIEDADANARRRLARDIQMIFQDPFASLNPRKTVAQIIGEVWDVHPDLTPEHGREREIIRLMERVGLSPEMASRFPHQFSGGQRQRIGIARAIALRPRLIVCDEPVSALDVSVQAQTLNLLAELQQEFGLAYLFIAHDLSVVRHISDELAVMYLGRIVETGPVETIYQQPAHPYSIALLSAIPVPRPWAEERPPRIVLEGDVPTPLAPPSGCRFHTRCFMARDVCRSESPSLRPVAGRNVACHFAEEALTRSAPGADA
ncbi:ABC transporter ATP-binding protein [Devosia sediminis]|uniref:Dipeptide ABC transporter ATP-binding protein n=1 Tax=Devosia sediminis TaxID=2798801 RepID=A0A934IVS7_9HYPH|nr:dipeptide ABC transporter ATP-binding protein [Devosia sediminis]MBJ3783110.1 dipeptide ABC transporter ATP-binding protein [Devosia sediminis]